MSREHGATAVMTWRPGLAKSLLGISSKIFSLTSRESQRARVSRMRRCRHVGASSWMLATAGTLAVLAVLRLDMPAATAERSCPDGEGGCGSAAASSRLRRLAAVGDGFLAGAGSGGLVGQGAPGQVDSPAALVARQAHVALPQPLLDLPGLPPPLVIVDANFPAASIGRRLLRSTPRRSPGVSRPGRTWPHATC